MTKQETYDYLRARGVAFEITEHPAVFNMEECAAVDMPYPEDDAKNIFVRDAKKQNYYLITIRHDKRAYVTTSEDGLHFGELKSWTWDDGSDLGSYNTQAHWVTQQDALYLVYTRRGANNDHVMRHRAPLFISKVDPKAVTVIRADERELVPQRGARLGNFGITEVNENETWVTVSEWMQTTGPDYADFTQCMKYGSNNAVFASRIQWRKPNTSWNQH